MPQAVAKLPTTDEQLDAIGAPQWLKPENASVFDPPWRASMRDAVQLVRRLTGADDPKTQIVAGAALENPQELGGAVKALADKFPRLANAIKAWHGTPHEFTPVEGAPLGKFDPTKIGTGEGAQAFSHGHYLAEQRAVGQVYADTLTTPLIGGKAAEEVYKAEPQSIYDVLRGMKTTNPDTTIEQAANVWDTIKHRARVVDNVVSYGQSARGMMRHDPKAVALYDKMLASGELTFPKGHLYELNIHADPEHFLDWDKPLAQQSPYVREKLGTLGTPAVIPTTDTMTREQLIDVLRHVDRNGTWTDADALAEFGKVNSLEELRGAAHSMDLDDYLRATMTGSDQHATGQSLYLQQTARLGGGNQMSSEAARKASEALQKAGIPGVRYLDNASRATGEGTRNYVVFPGNEHLIEILKKYGLLLPMAGAGAAATSKDKQ